MSTDKEKTIKELCDVRNYVRPKRSRRHDEEHLRMAAHVRRIRKARATRGEERRRRDRETR